MNELMRIIKQIFRPLLFPFRRMLIRPRHLFRTIPRLGIRKVQRFIRKKIMPKKKKEPSLKNYFSWGRFYVAKKLLLFFIIGVALLSFYLYTNTPEFLQWGDRDEIAIIHEEHDKDITHTGEVQLFDTNEDLKYEGHMTEGQYDGQGKLYDQGQLIYEGDFVQGTIEGNGKQYNERGLIIYEGAFVDGKKEGMGKKFNDQETIVYEGSWEDNVREGLGKEFNDQGQLTYQGEFSNDVYSGQGKAYSENENLEYEGEFQHGEYHGPGTLYYANGNSRYEGNFRTSQFDGQGKLYQRSGELVYDGSFNKGVYSGEGTKYDESGLVLYEGEFLSGIYHGSGKDFYENGQIKYAGTFTQGTYNGSGEHFDEEGHLKYDGRFKDGKYEGIGALYNSDEFIIYKGFFENGQVALHRFLQLSHPRVVELYGEPTAIEVLVPYITLNQESLISSSSQEGSTNESETSDADTNENDQSSNNNDTGNHPDENDISDQDDSIEEEITLEIEDMQSFNFIFEDFRLAFSVERSDRNPNDTGIFEIRLWDRDLLANIKANIDDLTRTNKSGDLIAEEFFQNNDGTDISLYIVEDVIYTFYFDEDQETIIQVKVKQR